MPKGGNGKGKLPKIVDQTFGTFENPDDGPIGFIEANVNPDKSSWSILSGNGDDAFAIDQQTGQLFVDGSKIDYETEPEQTRILTVQVTENGKKFYSAEVTVNISDVNEAPSAGDTVVEPQSLKRSMTPQPLPLS